MSDNDQKKEKISFVSLLISTLGAAFGVQSDAIRERDFKQSSPIPYIVAGILFTVVFVFSLIFLVSFILSD